MICYRACTCYKFVRFDCFHKCHIRLDGMYHMSLSNDIMLGVGKYNVTGHRHTYHLIPANNDPCYVKENVMSYYQ